MEYITSNKGGRKLAFENNIYIKQKVLSNGAVCWECNQRRTANTCKAKIHVLNDQVIRRVNEHTHNGNSATVEASKIRSQMKKRARETEEPPQQIISIAVGLINDQASAAMPAVHHILRDLRRQRQRKGNPLPCPQDTRFDIPDEYQVTTDGKPFMMYDSGPGDGNRIIVFATEENIELLAHSPTWFMDGTFKTAPELFFQLYTIHSCSNDRVIPCVYALLPNKQQTTYARFFDVLLDDDHLQPQTVMVDFEIAVLNAVRGSFPNSALKGCFFHFCQAIYRKVQSLGLQNRYRDDDEFNLKIRMLAAVAFVPTTDVIRAFESLSENLPLDAPAQAIIDYFEDTYIGRLRPGGQRRDPLFPITVWNMYEQTLQGLPRTNNAVEGWHRSFQANVGGCHPNFWKFIDILKREQNLAQVHMAQARAGHQPEPQRRRYQDSNQRILNIVQDFNNRDIIDYLRGIAFNIAM